MARLSTWLVAAAVIVVAPAAMAAPVYSNDFSSTATDFTGAWSVKTSPSGQGFLASSGPTTQTTLSLIGLAAHTEVDVAFTIDVVGSMDGTGSVINGGGAGDFFTVSYLGATAGTAFNQAFANYGGGNLQTYPTPGSAPATGATTTNALGYSGFPDSGNGIQDSEYSITLTIPDAASNFALAFTDGSNEGTGNEFYGIDNVDVSIVNNPVTTVPERFPSRCLEAACWPSV
ncbi:hypothetical protein [Acidisphaera sp. L21]|uniref:hypothetical protein n=1 Tax=Acidisphaera sp. L21 TaxID=1641851 RepID=UPI00131BD725|nr:hypothetical protein [Acidisphaera sp. L21]